MQLLVSVLYIVIMVIPFVDTGGPHDIFVLFLGIFRLGVSLTSGRQRGKSAKFPPDMPLDTLVVGTNQEEPWSRVILDEMIEHCAAYHRACTWPIWNFQVELGYA